MDLRRHLNLPARAQQIILCRTATRPADPA
jgi:hypothetical protein